MYLVPGLLQSSESSFVVGLISDFGYEFFVNDSTFFVNDDDSTCEKALERTVDDADTVVGVHALATECTADYDIFNTFSGAETTLCEGEVLRDAEHYGIVETGCFLIETTYRSCTHGSVKAGENVDDNTFAEQVGQMEYAQIAFNGTELGGFFAYFGEFTVQCNR